MQKKNRTNFLLITLNILLSLISIPQSVNSQKQLEQSQQPQLSSNQDMYHYSHHQQWFCFNYFNSTNEDFDCCYLKPFLCTERGPLIRQGQCATFDGINLYIGLCTAYFQPSVYNTSVEHHSVYLPVDLIQLNESMCGPLNRKGLLCSECLDGYGISVTSFRYKCTECTGVWYAIPLYLLLEYLPLTIFYLIVLTFKVSITSPPMPCFIMYAQIIIYMIDQQEFNESLTILSEYGELILSMKIIRIFYGMFSLEFFRYVSPPLCLNRSLKPIQILLLHYLTFFYPLFLIFVTWLSVKLHDRNVRLFVCLWKPFHKCFARLHKQWDTKTDLIDVFITFFILSCYKLPHLASPILRKIIIYKFTRAGVESTDSTRLLDPSGNFFELTHLLLASFLILVIFIFNILPSLVLILYPTKAFRYCLSKCHLNSTTIFVFTDKIQSPFRNGLDGGRDMRGFSGFYPYIMMIFLHTFSRIFHHALKTNDWESNGMTLFIVTVIIAVARPYRKSYMNIIDILLLTNLAILYFSTSKSISAIYILLVSPLTGLLILAALKILHQNKLLKTYFSNCCNNLKGKLKVYNTSRAETVQANNTIQDHESRLSTLSSFRRPLIHRSLILSEDTNYGAV